MTPTLASEVSDVQTPGMVSSVAPARMVTQGMGSPALILMR